MNKLAATQQRSEPQPHRRTVHPSMHYPAWTTCPGHATPSITQPHPKSRKNHYDAGSAPQRHTHVHCTHPKPHTVSRISSIFLAILGPIPFSFWASLPATTDSTTHPSQYANKLQKTWTRVTTVGPCNEQQERNRKTHTRRDLSVVSFQGVHRFEVCTGAMHVPIRSLQFAQVCKNLWGCTHNTTRRHHTG